MGALPNHETGLSPETAPAAFSRPAELRFTFKNAFCPPECFRTPGQNHPRSKGRVLTDAMVGDVLPGFAHSVSAKFAEAHGC